MDVVCAPYLISFSLLRFFRKIVFVFCKLLCLRSICFRLLRTNSVIHIMYVAFEVVTAVKYYYTMEQIFRNK